MSNFTYEDFTKVRTTYVPGEDPGAIGAGKIWVDSTTGIVKVRNAANTGWDAIGGSQPPNSWLDAHAAEVDATTGASGNLAWTLDGNAGTDISIDGGDDTTINIATPGEYTLCFQTPIIGSGGGAGFASLAVVGTIGEQDWLLDANNNPFVADTLAAGADITRQLVMIPVVVASACTVQINYSMEPTAGTLKVGGTLSSLTIRRLS